MCLTCREVLEEFERRETENPLSLVAYPLLDLYEGVGLNSRVLRDEFYLYIVGNLLILRPLYSLTLKSFSSFIVFKVGGFSLILFNNC